MTTPSHFLEDVLASDLVDDPSRSAAAEPERAVVTARRRRLWGEQAWLGAVSLGALGAFLVVHRTVRGPGRGNAFDRDLLQIMGRARGPATNTIARGVTVLGSVHGAVAVTLAAMWATLHTPRRALQVAVGALGGVVSELFLKRLFGRARPTLLEHLETVGSTAFPSGHSMAAASLYPTLAFVASRGRTLRDRRGALLAGAGAVAVAVGVTRVHLGVHWPTDVLGGLCLGTAWACSVESIFDLSGARTVELEAGSAP